MKKLNNKGFSLVELIVVVLIMAIIAVALAPQVMKWVEESRKSTDANNYDTIVEACNTALADQNTLKESNAPIVITANATTPVWAVSGGQGGHSAFDTQMNEILGTSWATSLQVKASETVAKEADGSWGTTAITYTITVEKGHVYRTIDTTGARNS
ncbi:MAG: type II secretion system GspH family protein [Lachnospiraceae bacterium]|nr:type II secretion system GspH family protein [Lachnospiraceae bacterium]